MNEHIKSLYPWARNYDKGGPIKKQNLLAGMKTPEQVAAETMSVAENTKTQNAIYATEQRLQASRAQKERIQQQLSQQNTEIKPQNENQSYYASTNPLTQQIANLGYINEQNPQTWYRPGYDYQQQYFSPETREQAQNDISNFMSLLFGATFPETLPLLAAYGNNELFNDDEQSKRDINTAINTAGFFTGSTHSVRDLFNRGKNVAKSTVEQVKLARNFKPKQIAQEGDFVFEPFRGQNESLIGSVFYNKQDLQHKSGSKYGQKNILGRSLERILRGGIKSDVYVEKSLMDQADLPNVVLNPLKKTSRGFKSTFGKDANPKDYYKVSTEQLLTSKIPTNANEQKVYDAISNQVMPQLKTKASNQVVPVFYNPKTAKSPGSVLRLGLYTLPTTAVLGAMTNTTLTGIGQWQDYKNMQNRLQDTDYADFQELYYDLPQQDRDNISLIVSNYVNNPYQLENKQQFDALVDAFEQQYGEKGLQMLNAYVKYQSPDYSKPVQIHPVQEVKDFVNDRIYSFETTNDINNSFAKGGPKKTYTAEQLAAMANAQRNAELAGMSPSAKAYNGPKTVASDKTNVSKQHNQNVVDYSQPSQQEQYLISATDPSQTLPAVYPSREELQSLIDQGIAERNQNFVDNTRGEPGLKNISPTLAYMKYINPLSAGIYWGAKSLDDAIMNNDWEQLPVNLGLSLIGLKAATTISPKFFNWLTYDIPENNKFINKANQHFLGYENIPQYYALSTNKTNNAVKDLIQQHNTYVRGVRDTPNVTDIVAKSLGKVPSAVTKDDRIRYMATHYAPETKHGRAGMESLPNDIGTIYTSNSFDTAAGYASTKGSRRIVQGETDGSVAVVRRKYQLGKDRNNWLIEGDVPLIRTMDLPRVSEDMIIDNAANSFRKKIREDLLSQAEQTIPKFKYKTLNPFSLRDGISEYITDILLQRAKINKPLTKKSNYQLGNLYSNVRRNGVNDVLENSSLTLQKLSKLTGISTSNIKKNIANKARDLQISHLHSTLLDEAVDNFITKNKPIFNQQFKDLQKQIVSELSKPNYIYTTEHMMKPEDVQWIDDVINNNARSAGHLLKHTPQEKQQMLDKFYQHYIFTGPVGQEGLDFVRFVSPEEITTTRLTRGHFGGFTPGLSRKYFSTGGSIHIKPENRGKFTAAANRAGKSVQAYASQILANKDHYSTTLVKRANFAKNSKKFHH